MNDSGYTLVELVIVIALSAILLIVALQGSSTRNSNALFVSDVEKIKSVIKDAQNQGQTGRADSNAGNATHIRTNCDKSQLGPGQKCPIDTDLNQQLCATKLRITPSDNPDVPATYEAFRVQNVQKYDSDTGNLVDDPSHPGTFEQSYSKATLTVSHVSTLTLKSGPDADHLTPLDANYIDLFFVPPTSDGSFTRAVVSYPGSSTSLDVGDGLTCTQIKQAANTAYAGSNPDYAFVIKSAKHEASIELFPLTGLLTSKTIQ